MTFFLISMIFFLEYMLLGEVFAHTNEQTPVNLNCELVLNINPDKKNLEKCIHHHVFGTFDWISKEHAKKRAHIISSITTVLGAGVLNDIPKLKKKLESKKTQETESKENNPPHKIQDSNSGEGVVGSIAALTPYIFFAGADFALAATLIVTGEWLAFGGASYLALTELFKATKFVANEQNCKKMCSQSDGDSLIAQISAFHFGQVVDSIIAKEKKEEEDLEKYKQEIKDNTVYKELIKGIKKDPDFFDMDFLLTNFSKSMFPEIEAYTSVGGHCLTKCSDSSSSVDFICNFIKHLDPRLDKLLYFARILSASHTNLISFDGISNSNLAKFLKKTRPHDKKTFKAKAKRFFSVHIDKEKYGSAKNNTCVMKADQEAMIWKIDALIKFQLSLEEKAVLKKEKKTKAPLSTN